MGATEEEMAFLSAAKVSHVSYILILYSISFLLFLFVSMLLHLYTIYAWPVDPSQPEASANGGLNGHAQVGQLDRRVKDAEEFELEGLMSEDEENGVEASARG